VPLQFESTRFDLTRASREKSGFSVDLQQLRDVFESVAAFGWNSRGFNCRPVPHVYFEGVFQGHEVFLQVLDCAPRMKNPG
jgi:hypothetical protein